MCGIKIKIFSFHEKIYKWIAYFSVLIISIMSIYYYFQLEDRSDTFIIGTLYALLLFVIGIYLTNNSDKIRRLSHSKKQQYLDLKELKELFANNSLNFNSFDKVFSFIVLHRIVTGRNEAEIINEQFYKYKKRFNYITYTRRYLNLEDEIYNQYIELSRTLNSRINKYINDNNLTKNVKYINLTELDDLIFNIGVWQSDYLDLKSTEKDEFFKFNDSMIQDLNGLLKKLKKDIKNIARMHNKYYSKINKEIKRMEKVYGERLIEEIIFIDNLNQNLSDLKQLISDSNDELLTYSDMEKVKISISKLDRCFQDIDFKIESIMEAVDSKL